MADTLTIRNLTTHALIVRRAEHFDIPPPIRQGGGFFASNLTALLGNVTSPRDPAALLAADAIPLASQDLDVRSGPLSTITIGVKIAGHGPHAILRLTFETADGGQCYITLPTPSPRSQVLTTIGPDHAPEYSGIYLARSSLLAIYEQIDLQKWLRDFKDHTPLAALSIPGTHNSPTCHKALPSVRCQVVPPLEQLRNGVRFFDVRVQPGNPNDPSDDTLYLVHGAFPVSLTGAKKLRPLLDEMQTFLRNNPSETIILSLKREGTGSATDQQLSRILKEHYVRDDDASWYTEPRVPRLGEVRGKIVILRRFALDDQLRGGWGGRGWCLDAERWADNTPNCIHGDVCVQDFYGVMETVNIDEKIKYCCEHFERAAKVVCPVGEAAFESAHSVSTGPLYLNFLSASNFWKAACWPDKIAARLNPAVTAFLCEKHNIGDRGADEPGQTFDGDGAVGIVVCDWVGKDGDWDLVRCIVSMNGRLLLRQRRLA